MAERLMCNLCNAQVYSESRATKDAHATKRCICCATMFFFSADARICNLCALNVLRTSPKIKHETMKCEMNVFASLAIAVISMNERLIWSDKMFTRWSVRSFCVFANHFFSVLPVPRLSNSSRFSYAKGSNRFVCSEPSISQQSIVSRKKKKEDSLVSVRIGVVGLCRAQDDYDSLGSLLLEKLWNK